MTESDRRQYTKHGISQCSAVTHYNVAIIVPVINELEHLKHLLSDIGQQKAVNLVLYLADGGSTDGTIEYAKAQNIPLIISAPGRAQQMNKTAQTVTADLYLFLHADTRLPTPCTLKHAIARYDAFKGTTDGVLAGHFPIRFTKTQTNHHALFWRYAEEKTAFNRPDTINGDQGLLISPDHFWQLGGFDETHHFLEDQKISEKIFNQGKWILLPGYLVTSARRFEREGEHRLYILMAIIMGLFKTGFDDFFELAPALYRQQNQTEKLYLSPFFRLIWHIKIKRLGFKKSVIAWYRVGKYIRSHSWQLFYFFDQLSRPLHGRKVYPCLWFHDQILEKILKNPVTNTVTMLLAFFWFMGVLHPIYWWLESKTYTDIQAKYRLALRRFSKPNH